MQLQGGSLRPRLATVQACTFDSQPAFFHIIAVQPQPEAVAAESCMQQFAAQSCVSTRGGDRNEMHVWSQQLMLCALWCIVCRQQHLLATSQLQNMAKLLEDAASGRYKRAVDPSASTAAAPTNSDGPDAASAGTSSSTSASDSKQVVLTELTKAAAKQAKLVDILQGLQQQVPELQDDLGRVLLHAAATSMWLQPQAAGEVH